MTFSIFALKKKSLYITWACFVMFLQTADVSDWTTPFRDIMHGHDRDELYVNNALEELVRWAYRVRNLPERDHIMLFTE